MKYQYQGMSVQGRRTNNEDNFIIFITNEDTLISVVADGMGGHKGGKVASALTIKLVERVFKKITFANLTAEEVQKRIIIAIREIQKKLIQASKSNPELEDMGTTLNLNVFLDNKMFTLNIGDSRTSQFSKKEITRISEDHNLATLAMKDKSLERFKGFSNYLTSSLGPNKETKVDMFITSLNKKGYIIITTDGIHNFVSEKEMIKILKVKNEILEKLEEITTLAYDNNSNDNMTIILVKYGN